MGITKRITLYSPGHTHKSTIDNSLTTNEYQQTLYSDLMALCNGFDRKRRIFFYKDHAHQGSIYRIFSYQLASYAQFKLPNALECRGHMFEINSSGRAVRLASLPVEKFFNISENPFTQELDFENPMLVMRKEDGSLISTYLHGEVLSFKSKASLTSSQVVDTNKFIRKPENVEFRRQLLKLEREGYTINLEYTAPDNRIVLSYEKPALTVLSIRNRQDGTYLQYEKLDPDEFGEIRARFVEKVGEEVTSDMSRFLTEYKKETGIEGYVIQLATGQFCKAKTEWYFNLHHIRGNLEGEKLFNCVLDATSDDIKAVFADDVGIFTYIEGYEETVIELLTGLQDTIDSFYEENSGLVRKNYYAKAANELERWQVNLAMTRLKGEIDDDLWKNYLKKSWVSVKHKFKETELNESSQL